MSIEHVLLQGGRVDARLIAAFMDTVHHHRDKLLGLLLHEHASASLEGHGGKLGSGARQEELDR